MDCTFDAGEAMYTEILSSEFSMEPPVKRQAWSALLSRAKPVLLTNASSICLRMSSSRGESNSSLAEPVEDLEAKAAVRSALLSSQASLALETCTS